MSWFTADIPAVDPPRAAAMQYVHNQWTTNDGLPQVSVNSILQTRDGFLWLTTFGGLVRYDGLRFQVFNSGNSAGLKTSRFLNLFEDKDDNLWITTEGQGITRYRNGNFTTFSTENNLPGNQINRMEENADGQFLITVSGQIFVWNNDVFAPYSPTTGEPVENILHRTKNGAIWYLENSKLRKFANGQATITYAPDFSVSRVFEDSSGRLWIARNGKNLLSMLKDGKLTDYSEKDGYPKSRFLFAAEDRQGTIWFATSSGLVRFQNDEFTRYGTADGLVSDGINYVFHDREGTIWVGTTGGLIRLTVRTVTAFSAADGLAADNVYPIYQDRKNRIWIGSWGGLTVYENGVFRSVGERYAVADKHITALFEDRDGAFWIGNWGGEIRRVKDERVKTFLPASKMTVRVFYQDRAGTIWIGTSTGLVKSPALNAKNQFEDDSPSDVLDLKLETTKITEKDVFAIHEDRHGRLWIGTSAGLVKYENGVFTALTEADGIAPNIVRSIYEDALDTLWIGMYDSGLYRYADGKFTHFATGNGLFDNGAFQIVEDGAENFWISCNLGIYRVKKSDLNDFAEGRIAKITSILYNKRDGMLNAECNGGGQPAGIRASDGRIWFPTQKGVAIIDPDTVPLNSHPPPVVIESFLVDTKPIDFRLPVKIEPAQTNLEINYSGLSFINPELVKFKYKLEGLDADWIDASSRRTAFYSHLPAGTYLFKVIAANRDGVWNTEGAVIEITVLPPFWKTWWFFGFIFLGFGGIGFLFYRHRINKLEKEHSAQQAFSQQLIESQEKERKRIAAELHDSIGQSLVILKNRAVRSMNEPENYERMLAQMEEISDGASAAISEVRGIARNLHPYQIDFLGLTTALETLIESAAEVSDIEFTHTIDDLGGTLSKESEINLYRIVQEAVNNAVKHSGATEASISLRKNGQHLNLFIEDNGKGFSLDSKKAKLGFGLVGIGERAKMLNALLEFNSSAENGTTIYLEMNLPGEKK